MEITPSPPQVAKVFFGWNRTALIGKISPVKLDLTVSLCEHSKIEMRTIGRYIKRSRAGEHQQDEVEMLSASTTRRR